MVPLHRDHIPALFAIACTDPDRYRFTSTPVTEEQRNAYFDRALSDRDAGRAHPFTVLTSDGARILGTTRLTDIHHHHRNAELGYTWFHSDVVGTAVNSESKLMLFRFAFETLALIRIEIHADTRNKRSQSAIRAVGGSYEGVLRRHQVSKDGFIRDTMVFSVVDNDWAKVRKHLIERLRGKGVEPLL
jgi:RimJ/RimL family protein N-acetyltransferase